MNSCRVFLHYSGVPVTWNDMVCNVQYEELHIVNNADPAPQGIKGVHILRRKQVGSLCPSEKRCHLCLTKLRTHMHAYTRPHTHTHTQAHAHTRTHTHALP